MFIHVTFFIESELESKRYDVSIIVEIFRAFYTNKMALLCSVYLGAIHMHYKIDLRSISVDQESVHIRLNRS